MMVKQKGKKKKKKKHVGEKSGNSNVSQNKVGENSPNAYDTDTGVFISLAQELKDEGNKVFRKRDYEGAMLKYEKALKLLPQNHIDVSYLRTNMVACYMQMGLSEFPRATHECNLALEVTPKYSKALLKRATCYEALNRLELALIDVDSVLKMEPNNLLAIEISDRVKTTIEKKSVKANEVEIDLIPVPEYLEPAPALLTNKLKEKPQNKLKEKKVGDKTEKKKTKEKKDEEEIEKKAEDKLVVEEKKAEEKIEEKKADEKIEEKKDEEKIEEKKAEENIEEKKAEEKVQEKKAEEKIEEKKAEEKI